MKLSLLSLVLLACSGRIESIGNSGPTERGPFATASSASSLPAGIWTIAVQYAGDATVPPGGAVQVEVRSNGTAYRWVCDGAAIPDGMTAPCEPSARVECLATSLDWTGSHWRMAIAHPAVYAHQGELQVTSDGDLLIPYVNPTYSAALFERVADEDPSGPGCSRW